MATHNDISQSQLDQIIYWHRSIAIPNQLRQEFLAARQERRSAIRGYFRSRDILWMQLNEPCQRRLKNQCVSPHTRLSHQSNPPYRQTIRPPSAGRATRESTTPQCRYWPAPAHRARLCNDPPIINSPIATRTPYLAWSDLTSSRNSRCLHTRLLHTSTTTLSRDHPDR